MVEVEPDPAGKNSTSVDVAMLVTTASRIVSSVRVVKRRPDEHTRRVALSMGKGGQAGHEARRDEKRMHVASS
jgi:hypothetical protein